MAQQCKLLVQRSLHCWVIHGRIVEPSLKLPRGQRVERLTFTLHKETPRREQIADFPFPFFLLYSFQDTMRDKEASSALKGQGFLKTLRSRQEKCPVANVKSSVFNIALRSGFQKMLMLAI
jgi:hypothetical protein